MVTTESFLPYLQHYFPGASETAILRALGIVAERFCRDSRAVREDMDPLTVTPSDPSFELEVSDSSQLVAAEPVEVLVTVGTRTWPLEAATRSKLRREFADVAPDAPRYFTGRMRGFVHLIPTPNEPCSVVCEVAVAPKPEATELPDELYYEHREAIVTGVRAMLYAIPDRPYSDPAQARTLERDFVAAVSDAANYATAGGVKAPLRARAVP